MKEVSLFRLGRLCILLGFVLLGAACASRINPSGDLHLIEQKAHNALEQGELLKAESLDFQALSVAPHDAYILNNLAVVQDRLGKQNVALRTMQEANRIAPNNAEILLNLSRIELQNGMEEEAFRTAGQIVPMDKWPNGFRTLMGKIDIDLGKYHEAHVYLHEARERHPENPLILTYLGIVHYHLGDMSNSKKNFLEALNKNPSPRLRRALVKLLKDPAYVLRPGSASSNRKDGPPLKWPQGNP